MENDVKRSTGEQSVKKFNFHRLVSWVLIALSIVMIFSGFLVAGLTIAGVILFCVGFCWYMINQLRREDVKIKGKGEKTKIWFKQIIFWSIYFLNIIIIFPALLDKYGTISWQIIIFIIINCPLLLLLIGTHDKLNMWAKS